MTKYKTPPLSGNFTKIQNYVIDIIAPDLIESELRVLLFILRRTQGFNKDEDHISMSQFVKGIKSKEGEILSKGCGLKKAAVLSALKSLSEKGLIEKHLEGSPGNERRIIRLVIPNDTGDPKNTPPSDPKNTPPVIPKIPTKETNTKKTKQQQREDVVFYCDPEIAKARNVPAELVETLTLLGISEGAAYNMIQVATPEQIKKQIAWLPLRKPKNAAACLQRAILEDWSEPVKPEHEIKREKDLSLMDTQIAIKRLIGFKSRITNSLGLSLKINGINGDKLSATDPKTKIEYAFTLAELNNLEVG